MVTKSNLTAASLYSEASPFYGRTFMEKLSTDRDFLALALSMSFLVIIIIGLAVYHFSTRNKRPIITKRVFVNRTRNLTPLTQRPETTTERCEVTIENCCNMNVCETVIFLILLYYISSLCDIANVAHYYIFKKFEKKGYATF